MVPEPTTKGREGPRNLLSSMIADCDEIPVREARIRIHLEALADCGSHGDWHVQTGEILAAHERREGSIRGVSSHSTSAKTEEFKGKMQLLRCVKL